MLGLRFDVEGVYFCCFRQPTTTSVILSYSVPPFTTIRGLLECAIGLPRDSYYLQDKIRIGIQPFGDPEKITELSRILKLVTRQKERTYLDKFPSAPMFRTFLVNPLYRIYLTGADAVLMEIEEKLKDPERICYMGQSDDMVDIRNVFLMEIHKEKSTVISGIIEGVLEDCEVVRLPYRFVNNGKDVEMKVISVPKSLSVNLGKEVECWRFDTGDVILF
jgi:CRISPR-associated protein Cas5h